MDSKETGKSIESQIAILKLEIQVLKRRLDRHIYGNKSKSPYDLSGHPLKRKKHV